MCRVLSLVSLVVTVVLLSDINEAGLGSKSLYEDYKVSYILRLVSLSLALLLKLSFKRISMERITKQ